MWVAEGAAHAGTEDGQCRWGGNEQHYTATLRSIPPPKREALSTFSLTLTMCLPPGRLPGVRPQERVQRDTVEQIGDSAPFLPSLDVLVPLVEQLVDVLRCFDSLFPVAEQVIDVPKIFVDDVPPRTSAREPQLAEHGGSADNLVLSQAADCRADRRHSSSCWWKTTRWSSRFSSQAELTTAATVAQIFDFLVHLHYPHLQLVFMKTQMSLVKVFFALFQGAWISILAWENMCSAFCGPLVLFAFMLRFIGWGCDSARGPEAV